MHPKYSFIIPVYNRPNEIRELLESMQQLSYDKTFEVVIIEDGSTVRSNEIVEEFRGVLEISYFYKPNSGPGDSRNYGMAKARADYFIILDSDVILPENYLQEVDFFLKQNNCDCYGGPDASHPSFSNVQKAIDYSMTSFFTTGGLRGGSDKNKDFQPRSFNMGISRKAFEHSKGFRDIHPGEDPDLSLRLKKAGFSTCLISNAKVYHKRRIDWHKFYMQVKKFGIVRPILNKWHPGSAKITYWFPSVFIVGLLFALFMALYGNSLYIGFYLLYFFIIAIDAAIKNKSVYIGVLAVIATLVQFIGYGSGFLESWIKTGLLNRSPRKEFPNLFFKKDLSA